MEKKKKRLYKDEIYELNQGDFELLKCVRALLWDNHMDSITSNAFFAMQKHVISLLAAPLLASMQIPNSLREEWKKDIIQQIIYNESCIYALKMIPLNMPYVILKGTNAAKYYPKPELRALGDIDIMTKRDDAEAACEALLINGYREITSTDDVKEGRHRAFVKHGIPVEIHYYFAAMNDSEKAKTFDDLIVNNIGDTHDLPDLINGLVLIEHINQHLEHGLGLRQIIDWMMFVDKCLTDENWGTFDNYIKRTGLETLTIVTTRMCEIYLGLSEHSWCRNVDKKICKSLMGYILDSGNFGSKRTNEEKKSYIRFSQSLHPIKSLNELQRRGMNNWPAARNPLLRPFAWIWESMVYFKDFLEMSKNMKKAKSRERLLSELDVKRKGLGMAKYQNGTYFIPHE